MLHVAFVRSVHAHARLRSDRHGRRAGGRRCRGRRHGRGAERRRLPVARAVGAADVCRDGAARARVAQGALLRRGRGRRRRRRPVPAEDAAGLVAVEYEPLPAVVGCRPTRAGPRPSSTTRRPTMSCSRAGSTTATWKPRWRRRPPWSSGCFAPTGRRRRRSRAAAAWRTGMPPRASSRSTRAPRSRTSRAMRWARSSGCPRTACGSSRPTSAAASASRPSSIPRTSCSACSPCAWSGP